MTTLIGVAVLWLVNATRLAYSDGCFVVRDTIFFFFFQAEDGIRDLIVTGVQTCALPILPCSRKSKRSGELGLKNGPSVCLRVGASPSSQAGVGGRLGSAHAGPASPTLRSEERRVGEEGRSRWSPDH